ncbi:MAG: hypothetical protein HY553_22705 [Elusimicrobia bacterium]|nr:hypothetical protein [Elusimicrobiota bacterium]
MGDKLKRAFFGLIILASLGATAFFAFAIQFVRAERAYREELANLGKAPVREVPPGQQNAGELYLAAAKLIPPELRKSGGKVRLAIEEPWSDPDGTLARWLDESAPALVSARKAATLAFCDFLPGDVKRLNLTTSAGTEATPLYALGLALLLDARRREAAADPQAALEDVLAALAISRRLHEQKTPLVTYSLLANIIQDAAFAPAASLLGNPATPPTLYVQLRDALVSSPLAAPALARAFALERPLFEEANSLYIRRLLWFFPKGAIESLVEDCARAERAFAALLTASAERNDPSGIDQRQKELRARFSQGARKPLEALGLCMQRRKEFGDCFLATATDFLDYGGVVHWAHLADAKQQVLFAAAGVRLRELQLGVPPSSLRELVPEHLPRAPYDPFDSGKELRYNADGKGWIVYSLGPDRHDGHGTELPPPQERDDWRSPAKGDVILAALRWIPPKAPRKTSRRAG